MKMEECLKRMEKKQKRVLFCKLRDKRTSKNREYPADKDLHRKEHNGWWN